MVKEPFDILKKFYPFQNFSEIQFQHLKTNATEMLIPKNKILLKLDATHDVLFFLLRGTLSLKSSDGSEEKIDADSSSARQPVAQFRPSLYEVSTYTDVEIIAISEYRLHQLESLQDDKRQSFPENLSEPITF